MEQEKEVISTSFSTPSAIGTLGGMKTGSHFECPITRDGKLDCRTKCKSCNARLINFDTPSERGPRKEKQRAPSSQQTEVQREHHDGQESLVSIMKDMSKTLMSQMSEMQASVIAQLSDQTKNIKELNVHAAQTTTFMNDTQQRLAALGAPSRMRLRRIQEGR